MFLFLFFSLYLFILFALVDDASGHYTTGYFWGNNYWMGSMTLCRSIYKENDDDFHERTQSSNVGLTFTSDHNANANVHQLPHENPPFFPRFAVLKININETTTTPIVS